MRIYVRTMVGLVVMSVGIANGEIRTWTSAGGQHTIEAEFAGMKDGVVTLRNADGKTTDVPLDKLSTADRKFAEKFAAAGEAKPTEEESIAATERLGGKFGDGGKVMYLKDAEDADAGLAHLKGLTGLEVLQLSHTEVTDAGLAHLKGMAGLKKVILIRTKVTDAGLTNLKGLTGLKVLMLSGTEVTDAGLAHLKGLTGLKLLGLRGTKVTDAGVAKLKAALPGCSIRH